MPHFVQPLASSAAQSQSSDTRANQPAHLFTPHSVVSQAIHAGGKLCGSDPFTTDWIVVDVETTGLDVHSAITEIGAIRVRRGTPVSQFHSYVNPGVPIPSFISSLTGITEELVADADPIEDVFPRFLRWSQFETPVDAASQEPPHNTPTSPVAEAVFVAHNAPFDLGFLSRAAQQSGMHWPRVRVIDTLTLARIALPRPKVANHKLATIAHHFNTQVQPEHRTLDDAQATLEILMGLIELFQTQGPCQLEDLIDMSSTPTRPHANA